MSFAESDAGFGAAEANAPVVAIANNGISRLAMIRDSVVKFMVILGRKVYLRNKPVDLLI